MRIKSIDEPLQQPERKQPPPLSERQRRLLKEARYYRHMGDFEEANRLMWLAGLPQYDRNSHDTPGEVILRG